MEAIKMLIVEDDKITLDYLARMNVWHTLGIEVAATAINGKQGLNRYWECGANLVLSDVEMPFMNGLEMFREIRKENGQMAFLVISSYSEFSYVKEAMELGAWTYLLKNELSEQTVEQVLIPVISKIRERTEEAERAVQKELKTLGLKEPPDYEKTVIALR